MSQQFSGSMMVYRQLPRVWYQWVADKLKYSGYHLWVSSVLKHAGSKSYDGLNYCTYYMYSMIVYIVCIHNITQTYTSKVCRHGTVIDVMNVIVIGWTWDPREVSCPSLANQPVPGISARAWRSRATNWVSWLQAAAGEQVGPWKWGTGPPNLLVF